MSEKWRRVLIAFWVFLSLGARAGAVDLTSGERHLLYVALPGSTEHQPYENGLGIVGLDWGGTKYPMELQVMASRWRMMSGYQQEDRDFDCLAEVLPPIFQVPVAARRN